MPRNYDEMRKAADRDFVVHGETFTVSFGSKALVGELEEMQKTYAESPETTYQSLMEFAEGRLLLMVDDSNGASDKLRKLIDEGHMSYSEIMDSARWAYELMTGVPTMPPAPSPGGGGKTGRSSRDA